jgi:hypothetical protein
MGSTESYQHHYKYKPLVKENGQFLVTSRCEGCQECVMIAGDNMAFDFQTRMSFVYRQPSEPEELFFICKAKSLCPQKALLDKTDLILQERQK